jgi:ribosomal-protein-alanine N-acetyltransferase
VRVAPVHEGDLAPYRRAVGQSRARLARWNPVDPDDLARALSLQSRERRTFLIHALTPEGDHDIVGKVNISDVVRGRFLSAAMGYDAYDPYAGRGLFAEGLRLVLDLLFKPEDAGGLGLHRAHAAVQPGNVRSAGLLRSLGFQREGFSPRMLWLPDPGGRDGWQDHDSYVMIRDEWPSQPYRPARRQKVVALVNGEPQAGAAALARALAVELAVPLLTGHAAGDGGLVAWWTLLADSPAGAVVLGSFGPEDARSVAEGLRRAGVNPAAVPEIWCSARGAQSDRLLGPGLAVCAEIGEPGRRDDQASRADIVRIALLVRASLTTPASET